MATAQVVETSVTVNNNSPIQDHVHLDDQTQSTLEHILISTFCNVKQFCYELTNQNSLSVKIVVPY